MDAIQTDMKFVDESRSERVGFTNRKQIPGSGTEISESGQIIKLQCGFRAAVVIGYEVSEKDISRGKSVIDASGELIQFSLTRHCLCNAIA